MKTIRTTSIPKIRKIHSGVWKLQAKNSQNCQYWPKNGQILALKGQIFAIAEFSRNIHYDLLKEDHKSSFHTKNYENLQRCLEDIGQKHYWLLWPKMAIFDHFGVKEIFDQKIFQWSSKWYGNLTAPEKKTEKISNDQGCRTGTNVRTYVRTHARTYVRE